MGRGVACVHASLEQRFHQCACPGGTAYHHWLPGDSLGLLTTFQRGLPALRPLLSRPLQVVISVWSGGSPFLFHPYQQSAERKTYFKCEKLFYCPSEVTSVSLMCDLSLDLSRQKLKQTCTLGKPQITAFYRLNHRGI